MLFYPRMVKELYISIDVETDGPAPGKYSMTALGAVLAGYCDKDGEPVKLNPLSPENRFYAELRPISKNWLPKSMKVGLFQNFGEELASQDLDGTQRRSYIEKFGQDPSVVMKSLATWVDNLVSQYQAKQPVFVSWPLGFDWSFTNYYFDTFAPNNKIFGHSEHFDAKSYFAAKANKPLSEVSKNDLPVSLRSSLPHTHLAVDDAAQQGEEFMNILAWDGK